MIPMIKWTLWQRRTSTMWWSIGVVGFILLNMLFYPSFKDQAQQLQQSFANLPDTAVQFFGGSTDFFSPVGFLNSQIFFLMLPLLLGVLAIGMGSNLISKEEQELTIESLLSRPISRSKLLLSKASAGVLILFAVTIIGLLATIISAIVVSLDISMWSVMLAGAACFILVLSFGAIAFSISAIGKARGADLGISAFIAIGGYVVSSLAGTVDWLKGPSKIFPFHYYQPQAILENNFNWNNMFYFAGVLILCVVISWLSFRRRDIY